MNYAIETKGMIKKYKKFTLGPLNIEIPEGFATVLIGSNGAGKTTLLKVLSGILSYEAGDIRYEQKVYAQKDVTSAVKIGFVPDTCFFPEHFHVASIKQFMKLGFDDFDEQRFDALCARFQIDTREEKRIKDMSLGSKMKLMVCAQLARNTKLLLLDEPASSLDPLMQDILRDEMRMYLKDEHHTIVYSTHNIEQVENVADYAVFMQEGKLLEYGFIQELCEKYRILRGDLKDYERVHPYVSYLETHGDTITGFCTQDEAMQIPETVDVVMEHPTLKELSIYLLKRGTAYER